MRIFVRILRKANPYGTGGADVKSPANVISGTAAPALGPDVNTAPLFARDDITLIPRFSIAKIHSQPASGLVRKRKRGASKEQKTKFDMMPVYSELERQGARTTVSLRTARTSLAAKAEEEMSEFEREYPW
jgi:hypothetical protein